MLKQLNSNHRGKEYFRLLAHELVYWINMNKDIVNTVKQSVTCKEYQHTQPNEKTIPHEMPYKPWEVVGTDIITIKKNTLLFIIDYYNKIPVVKKPDGLLVDKLI